MSLINNPYNQEDAQEAEVLEVCDECGGDLYEGDEAFKRGTDVLCSTECVLEYEGFCRETIGVY